MRPPNLGEIPGLDQFISTFRVSNVAVFVAPNLRGRGGMNVIFEYLFAQIKYSHISRIDLIDMKDYWLVQKLTNLLSLEGYQSIRLIYPEQGEGNYSLIAKC